MDSAEPEYAEFNSKLIPGKQGIIGVRVPTLRKIARQIIKDDWEGYLEDVPKNFEEEMLRGFVIATAPMDADRRIDLTEGYLDLVDNWATCDGFCSSWKFVKKDSEKVYSYFASLMDSGSEYRMRVSVVMRMGHFLDDEHIQDLLDDIIGYGHEGYYYKMGAAWTVSFCFIKFPDITIEYLESSKMDDWVRNKSIQKIIESYRVSDEDKQKVRGLRRRRSV